MLVLALIIHHKLNTRYNKAQYKFSVPVQLLEVLKVIAVSGIIITIQYVVVWCFLNRCRYSHDCKIT